MILTNLVFTSRSYTAIAILFILLSSGKCGDPPLIIADTNASPTALMLSVSTILENHAINTEVGTFSTIDIDAEDNHTYSLVSGEGDSDNNSFIIDGIKLISNSVFDFETQKVYSIRVQTDDSKGGTFQRSFTIDIITPPTAIALSALEVFENSDVGTLIGTLTSADTDADDTHSHSYSLVTGAGDSDNIFFSISEDSLLVSGNSVIDYEINPTLSIRIQSEDNNGGIFQMTFTILVKNLDEEVPTITTETFFVFESDSIGSTVGQVLATDDIGITSYTLISGNTAGVFKLSDDGLITIANPLDFETLSSYILSIEVRDGVGNKAEANFPITVGDTSFQLTNIDNLTLPPHPLSMSTAVISGTTYLFVAAALGYAVMVFSIDTDGTLKYADHVIDNITLEIGGASSVSTAVVSGTTYLFASGLFDDGVSVFRVADDGTLTNVDNVSDNDILNLDHHVSLSTAAVSGMTYLFAAGNSDDGISVFRVADDGTLTNVDNVSDNETLHLERVAALSTAVVSGTTYLFAPGHLDHGVSVFRVADDGTLTNVDNVSDNETLALRYAYYTHTTVISGITYLFVSGFSDDGFSVFQVADDGTLTNVDNVFDNDDLALNGAESLFTAVVDGKTLLFAAGIYDDGVSVFSVAPDGTVLNTDNIFDNNILNLNSTQTLTAAVISGTMYLYVAGATDNGLSIFRVVD